MEKCVVCECMYKLYNIPNTEFLVPLSKSERKRKKKNTHALQHIEANLSVYACVQEQQHLTHSSMQTLSACSRWLTGRGERDLTAVSAPCTCELGPESESRLLGRPLWAGMGPFISLPIPHC